MIALFIRRGWFGELLLWLLVLELARQSTQKWDPFRPSTHRHRTSRPAPSLTRTKTRTICFHERTRRSHVGSCLPSLGCICPAMASHVGFRLSAEHMRPFSRLMSMGRRFAFNKTVEEYRRLAKECRGD